MLQHYTTQNLLLLHYRTESASGGTGYLNPKNQQQKILKNYQRGVKQPPLLPQSKGPEPTSQIRIQSTNLCRKAEDLLTGAPRGRRSNRAPRAAEERNRPSSSPPPPRSAQPQRRRTRNRFAGRRTPPAAGESMRYHHTPSFLSHSSFSLSLSLFLSLTSTRSTETHG